MVKGVGSKAMEGSQLASSPPPPGRLRGRDWESIRAVFWAFLSSSHFHSFSHNQGRHTGHTERYSLLSDHRHVSAETDWTLDHHNRTISRGETSLHIFGHLTGYLCW